MDAADPRPTSSWPPRPASATRRRPGRQINASLERLQTDHVDLLQLHAIGDLEELDEVDRAPGGALEAALRAQDEGLVGAIGITGHGHEAPATHLEALRRHPFATVLTPLNPVLWRDEAYRADYEALVEEVQRQDAGLMTIKTVSRRNWPEGADQPYATWYEPLRRPGADHGRRLVGARAPRGHRPRHRRRRPPARHVIDAEQNRMAVAEAEALLADDEEYSSPFISMPF